MQEILVLYYSHTGAVKQMAQLIARGVEKVPGVRGSIGLYERSQAIALLNNRSTATVRDVMDVAVSVLAHRIKLKPSAQYLQSPEELVKEELEKFSSAKRGGDG